MPGARHWLIALHQHPPATDVASITEWALLPDWTNRIWETSLSRHADARAKAAKSASKKSNQSELPADVTVIPVVLLPAQRKDAKGKARSAALAKRAKLARSSCYVFCDLVPSGPTLNISGGGARLIRCLRVDSEVALPLPEAILERAVNEAQLAGHMDDYKEDSDDDDEHRQHEPLLNPYAVIPDEDADPEGLAAATDIEVDSGDEGDGDSASQMAPATSVVAHTRLVNGVEFPVREHARGSG